MTTFTRDRFNVVPAALVGVVLLGVGGFYGSFRNVTAIAALHHMDTPWLVPAVVDGAIAMFTLLDLGLTQQRKRVAWLHWVEWALVAVTVVLNVSGAADAFDVAAHSTLPLLWVAAVAATKATMAAQVAESSDRIPVRRWLCAPWPTLRLWRRMSVWGIVSYESGLDLERRRVLARIEDRHGSLTGAPARQRELYRLIAAAAGIDLDTAPPVAELAPAPATPARTASPRQPGPARRPRTRHPRPSTRAVDVDLDLVARIRTAAETEGIVPADRSQRAWLDHLRNQPQGGAHWSKVAAALRHLEEHREETHAPPPA